MRLWKAPKDIDPEVISLCRAINKLPGIRTVESCCGHGKTAYWIWFMVTSDEGLCVSLPRLCWASKHHTADADCRKSRWRVEVSADCAGYGPTFLLEGPIGAQGYDEAKKIARQLAAAPKWPLGA